MCYVQCGRLNMKFNDLCVTVRTVFDPCRSCEKWHGGIVYLCTERVEYDLNLWMEILYCLAKRVIDF